MRLGIDLGGTNLAYGLVDDKGHIVKRGAVELTDYDPVAIASIMVDIYESYSETNDIKTVGIGVPGVVSAEEGVVITCVNLKWKMVPLVTYLKGRIKAKIVIGNDANAACIGEVLFGGMKGYENAILLTLGTGVGGGVITGGRLLTGYQGAGGELGHMIIGGEGNRCNCGNVGCFETYVSASAIIRHYNSLAGKKIVKNAKEVFDKYIEGDILSKQVIDWFCHYFAIGIVNLYNIFAPEVIAIGGGVSQAFPIFCNQLIEEISRRAFSKDILYGKIVTAELLNDAGIIGAAYLDKY